MEDKFLYQLQEQPDQEFVNRLHLNLNQPIKENQETPGPNNTLWAWNHKRLLSVISLAVLALLVVAISPARARIAAFITEIGGQMFDLSEDYPGDNYPGDVITIEPSIMSLDEAMAAFPYSIQLPESIPPAFAFQEDQVRVYTGEEAEPFSNSIEFLWTSTEGDGLHLTVTEVSNPNDAEIVAPDSVEEVQLNPDQKAVLIEGGWDSQKQHWTNDIGVFRLRWEKDGLVYELMGGDEQLLIQIALSMVE